MTTTYIIIAIVVIIVLWLIGTYNGLIRLKNRTDEAWSDIDVQLKRRYDLIPNLVETVKGYAKQEQEVFTKVTQARAAAMGAQSVGDKAVAENTLSNTLKSLFAVSENYPELKSSANFLQLQTELTDTEDKIQAARRFYNGNVRDLNTKCETFPTNLVAGMLRIAKREFFEAAEGEKEPVKVSF
ncbi:MAG TPA: LemA family protein [Candidatus Saccharimonadales bacterium]|nr:LemA family protein [Candidatus Saccharimonadales bacterium]